LLVTTFTLVIQLRLARLISDPMISYKSVQFSCLAILIALVALGSLGILAILIALVALGSLGILASLSSLSTNTSNTLGITVEVEAHAAQVVEAIETAVHLR